MVADGKHKSDIVGKLFDCSAVATFAITPEHKVIYWNRPCEELTGFKASEIIGTDNHWQPFYDYKRPCLSDIVISGEYGRLNVLYDKSGRSVLMTDGLHAEGWYDNLGGRKRYIIFDAVPIYNQSGELIAAIETLQDITEHKEVEESKDELVLQLQKFIAENKTLAGFIPICASCKSVRDPDGKWLSLEKYIEDRSDARFSHGICPSCGERLYPGFYNRKK